MAHEGDVAFDPEKFHGLFLAAARRYSEDGVMHHAGFHTWPIASEVKRRRLP
jgi:hypothetical protein